MRPSMIADTSVVGDPDSSRYCSLKPQACSPSKKRAKGESELLECGAKLRGGRMVARFTAVVLISTGLLVGCRSSKDQPMSSQPSSAADAPAKEVTIAEVAQYLRDKTATVFDANGAETRKELGVVPGAVLLTSSKGYAMEVLPS